MRIERFFTRLIAVLAAALGARVRCEPAAERAALDVTSRRPRVPPADLTQRWAEEEESMSGGAGGRRGWARRDMALLHREGFNGTPVDCCPSLLEMVEPVAGRNQRGMYVELYRDGDNLQRFYDLSCRPDVENGPCRFVDKKFHNMSRCVQKFSYTYALVRDTSSVEEGETDEAEHHRHRRRHPHDPQHPISIPALPRGGGWMLDYIRVRSGCACEVKLPPQQPNKKRRNQQQSPQHHKPKKPKNRRPMEDDET